MKSAKWMLPVTLLLLSGLMTAQSITNSTVVANVPFDFMVNNKVIPAGDLVVKSAGVDGKILAVRNFDAHASALATASHEEQREASKNTMLIFKQYGGQYVLSGIRIEGSNWTYTLPETKAVQDLRAQHQPVSETTLLAVLR
jgi:hypothetical protein